VDDFFLKPAFHWTGCREGMNLSLSHSASASVLCLRWCPGDPGLLAGNVEERTLSHRHGRGQ
jgi:hypothetical protein